MSSNCQRTPMNRLRASAVAIVSMVALASFAATSGPSAFAA